MNMRASFPGRALTPEVQAEINRIAALWRDCRARFGAGGRFLFGRFTIADAMYAPVVSRFRTYGIELEDEAQPMPTRCGLFRRAGMGRGGAQRADGGRAIRDLNGAGRRAARHGEMRTRDACEVERRQIAPGYDADPERRRRSPSWPQLERSFGPSASASWPRAPSARQRLDAGAKPDFPAETARHPRRRLDGGAAAQGSARPPRRDHRPDRPQDGDQRAQLRRQRLHGRFRGRRARRPGTI